MSATAGGAQRRPVALDAAHGKVRPLPSLTVRAYLLLLLFFAVYSGVSLYLILNTPVDADVIPYGVP